MDTTGTYLRTIICVMGLFVSFATPGAAMDRPLRNADTESLAFSRVGQIENGSYRIVFFKTAWDGGKTFTHDFYVREDGKWELLNSKKERLERQWVILEADGDEGNRGDFYSTMTNHWVTFSGMKKTGKRTVTLKASGAEAYDLQVQFSLNREHPEVAFQLNPARKAHFVVGYQSFTGEPLENINEVLCGPLQHAKMVTGPKAYGEWVMSAPMSIYEKQVRNTSYTTGVYVPSRQLVFDHTQQHGPGKQRWGMSLRNNNGQVQPILYAPYYGRYSRMKPGDTYTFTIGLYAKEKRLSKAYEEMIRDQYDYSAYRKNVFDSSLTDTMFNLVELLKSDSGKDDSREFQPSPSGWWDRAKGFIDIENPQAVRTSSTGVLLSAYYLTRDDALYRERALPTIEYHLSRNYYGWTPKDGYKIYGKGGKNKMCGVPFDISSLSPLYNFTGRLNAGIYAIGEEQANAPEDFWLKRTPMSGPLAAYRMTEDKQFLKTAIQKADKYIKDELADSYTENVDPHDFQYYYSKHWTELLEMYEETGADRYLKAAHKEARRYATQAFVRPVPSGTVTVPQQPYRVYVHDRWKPSAIYDYPRSGADMKQKEVPKWVVSRNGITFEQLSTYKNPKGGFKMNPAEASFLLRLAYYTEDKLLRDVAHNMVIGRYTNYPGYYYRQHSVTHMKPDFPFKGPSGASMIYYHHAPAQLGMTIDYLVTEHITRSNEQIHFPGEFFANYVWFKFRLFGHRPGTFYGHENVWLWMPPDVVSIENHLVNWISAESGDTFYLSLTNSSDRTQEVNIDVNEQLVGIDPGKSYPVTVIRDNGKPDRRRMTDGTIQVDVSSRGITALIVDGVDIEGHSRERVKVEDTGDESYSFDKDTPLGTVKGILLMKPDLSRYNAYVQTDQMEGPVALHYSTDGGSQFETLRDEIYPFEWSIPIEETSKKFTYYLESGNGRTETRTIFFPYTR